MAYQKINRRRKYTKKKRYPLATAFITIIFCIGLSLGLAAQNHSPLHNHKVKASLLLPIPLRASPKRQNMTIPSRFRKAKESLLLILMMPCSWEIRLPLEFSPTR